MQVASELAARNQADAFSEVPVLEFAPRLLAAADIDARCCPGLPEGVEVPQDGIQRRIGSPGTRTTTVLTMSTCELLPLFSGGWSNIVVLNEATKARDDALPGPPRTSGRTRCPKSDHHW
jgi:hypothetical protein